MERKPTPVAPAAAPADAIASGANGNALAGQATAATPAWRRLLAPAPFAARLPDAKIRPAYTRWRVQVFAGIFLGYASYYLVRNNLALAIPSILKEHRSEERRVGKE